MTKPIDLLLDQPAYFNAILKQGEEDSGYLVTCEQPSGASCIVAQVFYSTAPGAQLFMPKKMAGEVAQGLCKAINDAAQPYFDAIRAASSAPVLEPGHDFFKDGDAGVPEAICDRCGSVALQLCKRCGKAEGELYAPNGALVPCEPRTATLQPLSEPRSASAVSEPDHSGGWRVTMPEGDAS